MRVLVANEPLSYREALARTLQKLRPQAEVRQTEPEELEASLKSFRPELVLCSRLPEKLPAGPRGWVELYPGGSGSSTLVLAEERAEIPDVQLVDILSVLDRLASQDNGTEPEARLR